MVVLVMWTAQFSIRALKYFFQFKTLS